MLETERLVLRPWKESDAESLYEYAKRAKEQWGKTPEYQEFEEKAKGWTDEYEQTIANDFMQIFAEFGQMISLEPSYPEVQAQVEKLQDYISEHFYQCTKEILASLGKMYNGGGAFTENIDKVGGIGTADFAAKAIEIYCK